MQIKTKEDVKRLYQQLKDRRVVLTQKEFSLLLGYNESYLPKVISGHDAVSKELIQRIEDTDFDRIRFIPPNQVIDYKAKYYDLLRKMKAVLSSHDEIENIEEVQQKQVAGSQSGSDSVSGIKRIYKKQAD